MALKNLFDMAKADRYTADGREALIKAQEAETEDKVYQIGEISQKTGLQKTANGWVKPKSGKQPGAKKQEEPKNVHGAEVDKIYERQLKRIKELKAKGFTDEQIDNDKIIKQTKEDMKNVGKKPENKPAEVSPSDIATNLDEITNSKGGTKNIGGVKVTYVPGNGYRVTHKAPTGRELTTGYDSIEEAHQAVMFRLNRIKKGEIPAIEESSSAGGAESKPDAADQRDQIGGEIKGNLEAAKYYFDKAQSFYPTDPSYKTYMTKAKQYNDEAKAQADDNGFDFEEMHNSGITQAVNKYAQENQDAAPRVLTGDCRIRIRKEKPALTGDTKIRVRK